MIILSFLLALASTGIEQYNALPSRVYFYCENDGHEHTHVLWEKGYRIDRKCFKLFDMDHWECQTRDIDLSDHLGERPVDIFPKGDTFHCSFS